MPIMLQATGLHTFYNNLSQIPEGALLKAVNVIIDRNGVIEPRRGFKQYGTVSAFSTDRARALFAYKGSILASHNNKLAFDQNDSGTFVDFNGTYSEVFSGLRIKGLEANSNFYFTTSDGIKKISASSSSQFTSSSGFIRNSGAVKALDVEATINYDTSGFLLTEKKVAYRVLWLYRDNNNNLIQGYPSSPTTVANVSTTLTGTVDLSFPIPTEITSTSTEYFYQIYRTAVSIDPNDEMQLIIEDYPTTTELTTTRVVSLNDLTPEDFRESGAFLYTNLNSGEGIEQANERPPLSSDMTLFQGSVFYSNTQSLHNTTLNLLSVSSLVSGTSKITITNGTTYNTYTFVGAKEITPVTFDTKANTTDGGYFLLNAAGNVRKYFIWFDKTGSTATPSAVDTVGRIPVKVDITAAVTAADVATAVKNAIDALDDFDATVLTATVTITNAENGAADDATDGFNVSAVSSAALVDETTDEISITSHGLIENQYITYTSTGTAIGGLTSGNNYYVINVMPNTFKLSLTAYGAAIDLTSDGTGTHNFSNQVGGAFAIGSITQGDGEDIAAKEILLSDAPTPSQQIDTTARSIVRVINQNAGEIVYAYYNTSTDELPGQILFEAKNYSTGEFFITSNDDVTTGAMFNPALPEYKSGTAATGTGTVTITSTSHGYSNGDEVVIYNSATTPTINGTYIISNVATNTFDISSTVTVSGAVTISSTDVSSDNELALNRIYFSKYQQPEAVPLVNYIDVGPKDKSILRILALRDSLFILKEDGIYRLTGNIAPNFNVTLHDNSAILIAPDSAVVLNNQIYALTNQGITRITDTGVGIVSRPIEDEVRRVTTNDYSYSTVAFGVSYETDRSYLLWLPSNENDTTDATQCLRFNTFTQAWTKWDKTNVGGVVNPRNDKLYLGAGSQTIEEERKDFVRQDQADYQYALQIPANGVNGTEVRVSTNVNIDIGDAIVQRQYVTISTFNRLLKKLDMDILVGDSDYYSTLGMVAGNDLSDKMVLLVAKLNADPSLTSVYTFSGTSDFATIQTEFNVMINTLNSDPGAFYSNYRESTGFVDVEATVDEKIKNTNKVIVRVASPFMEGNITHYKSILTDVIWAPQHFGDPSVLKQISEATYLFEDNVFTECDVSYSTDMSKNYDSINFSGVGAGDWGNFTWGDQNWGGEGSQVPFRTLIPLEKQRCRFINCRFEHGNALEQFALYGISFTPRVLSTRAYK